MSSVPENMVKLGFIGYDGQVKFYKFYSVFLGFLKFFFYEDKKIVEMLYSPHERKTV